MGNFFQNFATKQAFDAAFDVEAAVESIEVHIDRFLADSAATRDILQCDLAVPYGPTLREHLDIFPPRVADGKAPLLIFLHGGAWHMHCARDFSFVARGPVAAGMGAAIVTHDLCPDVGLGEIVRQVRSAIAWCARHASSFGCDPNRLIVMGHSAGGHLAAMAALTDWSRYGLPAGTVKACAPISGVFDMEPMALCSLQAHVRLNDTDIRWLSPSRILRSVPVHCVTVWGGAETSGYVAQSKGFARAWAEIGNRGSTLELPGKHHFEVLEGLASADSTIMRAVQSSLDIGVGSV